MIFHLKGDFMKKWSEIKQATLNKLFLDEQEAQQQGYLNKFQYLANECLNIISNGVKPRIVTFRAMVMDLSSYTKQVVGNNFTYDIDLNYIVYDQNGVSAEIVPDEETIYYVNRGEQYIFSGNNLLRVQPQGGYVIMPDNFLSFADMIGYLNGEPDPTIVYLDDRRVTLPDDGRYVLYYNATWDDITTNDIVTDDVLQIDSSILNCLPTYIASQCLSQDDITRAAILKNEFELMLARLDVNIMYESNHYKSEGGWY